MLKIEMQASQTLFKKYLYGRGKDRKIKHAYIYQ